MHSRPVDFGSPELISTFKNLQDLTGDFDLQLSQLGLEGVANPLIAIANLIRWLKVTSSPNLQWQHALENPEPFSRLMGLFGASQAIADSVIQNPELATTLFDSPSNNYEFLGNDLLAEGKKLLKSSTSASHGQDRLRFLKQKSHLIIVKADLYKMVKPSDVWRMLSDEADALIQLSLESSWKPFASENGITLGIPFAILGFGKLGSRELNYSSDVDLVFVCASGLDELILKQLYKFSQIFVRTLGEKMGRGSLYRVDLRLRPFGATGDIVCSEKSLRSYYLNYAEPWEVLALLRARWIVPSDNPELLDEIKNQVCFKSSWSEVSIGEILSMRAQIDAYSSNLDFKRGKGGIRDVEFLCQLFQLVKGLAFVELRSGSTLEVLQVLSNLGLIQQEEYRLLHKNYIFLRTLEHRCQLIDDSQTHELPINCEYRDRIARLMGLTSIDELEATLTDVRMQTAEVFDKYWASSNNRHSSQTSFPEGVRHWFLKFPNAEAFLCLLAENKESLRRVTKLLSHAKYLIPALSESIQLTELIVSGEVEEALSPFKFGGSKDQFSIITIAQSFKNWMLCRSVSWVLDPDESFSNDLATATCELLKTILNHFDPEAKIAMYALGSLARFEMTYESDADVLFLVSDANYQPEAEAIVQSLIAFVHELRSFNAPIALDIRLRPDGSQGLLVRSVEALNNYSESGMDLWERYALGQFRALTGNEKSNEMVDRISFKLDLTENRLEELLAMKLRIQKERVLPQQEWQNVKLGSGSLSDIEWLVHLFEMRFPQEMRHARSKTSFEKIQLLNDLQILDSKDADNLQNSLRFLLKLRHAIVFQGAQDSVLPASKDSLDNIADLFEFGDGNELIREYLLVAERTREIYEGGIKYLRNDSSN